jgi:hypothetical protein
MPVSAACCSGRIELSADTYVSFPFAAAYNVTSYLHPATKAMRLTRLDPSEFDATSPPVKLEMDATVIANPQTTAVSLRRARRARRRSRLTSLMRKTTSTTTRRMSAQVVDSFPAVGTCTRRTKTRRRLGCRRRSPAASRMETGGRRSRRLRSAVRQSRDLVAERCWNSIEMVLLSLVFAFHTMTMCDRLSQRLCHGLMCLTVLRRERARAAFSI